MKELRALTEEEFERARLRLMNPAPGSRIEAAQKYGIDLTLLVSQLSLTPSQRADNLERAAQDVEQIRGIARRKK